MNKASEFVISNVTQKSVAEDHNKNFGWFLLEYPATHDSSLEAKMSETAKLNYINSIERNCQLGTRLIHVKLYLSVLSLGNACTFSQVPQ